MKLRRRDRDSRTPATTLFYTADIHGADRCWRKFLGAGPFYGAGTVILGGDLTGKAVVPIELGDDGRFTATHLERRWVGTTSGELDKLRASIRFQGLHPWCASLEEIAALRDDEGARRRVFDAIIADDLQAWVARGDKLLARDGVAAFVMGGNDDPWSIEAVLDGAEHLANADDRILHVGEHELLSLGYSNITPWHTARELHDDVLYARLRKLADKLEDPSSAIFNIHVPPNASGLDNAFKVDEELRLVRTHGSPILVPVGSHAVRQIIEEFQPMLSLHGHIHESRAFTRIGRTLCVNPGSDYNSGWLLGAVVCLGEREVSSYNFVSG